MLLAGLIIAGVGAATVGAAIIFEIKTKEPKYLVIMKVACGFFGIGGILTAIGSLS